MQVFFVEGQFRRWINLYNICTYFIYYISNDVRIFWLFLITCKIFTSISATRDPLFLNWIPGGAATEALLLVMSFWGHWRGLDVGGDGQSGWFRRKISPGSFDAYDDKVIFGQYHSYKWVPGNTLLYALCFALETINNLYRKTCSMFGLVTFWGIWVLISLGHATRNANWKPEPRRTKYPVTGLGWYTFLKSRDTIC